jgi:hypothetical protein
MQMYKKRLIIAIGVALCATLFTAPACEYANRPLDADERRLVDSLAAAGISMQRYLIDSTCKVEQTTVVPHLIDSIKKVRQREIDEQIKAIPK